LEVTCDNCNKEFSMSVKEKKHGRGIIETYFICPNCNTKYSCGFTNERARKIQRQIRRLWDEIRGCGSPQLAETKKAKIDKLVEENKKIIDEFKLKFTSS
jgi:hypothetical protein